MEQEKFRSGQVWEQRNGRLYRVYATATGYSGGMIHGAERGDNGLWIASTRRGSGCTAETFEMPSDLMRLVSPQPAPFPPTDEPSNQDDPPPRARCRV